MALSHRQCVSQELLASQAWEWFRSVGSPKLWLAPMVGQSEVAFRMLARKYGATMCSTEVLPMQASGHVFQNIAERRPLILYWELSR